MKPVEAFGVVVRSAGLVLTFSALGSLMTAVAAPGVILFAIPTLLAGLWLLRGGQAIVSFAYPKGEGTDRDLP